MIVGWAFYFVPGAFLSLVTRTETLTPCEAEWRVMQSGHLGDYVLTIGLASFGTAVEVLLRFEQSHFLHKLRKNCLTFDSQPSLTSHVQPPAHHNHPLHSFVHGAVRNFNLKVML